MLAGVRFFVGYNAFLSSERVWDCKQPQQYNQYQQHNLYCTASGMKPTAVLWRDRKVFVSEVWSHL